ncbi:MAG: protein translocase subunit SecD [Armatimonadetes bacterium CG07_land_8_20_14_0_80_59_28]|nr:MAG: protein translocase subunit SecD [Armatimonadetes bacterium CG07_land_8_20_14_0_80_59_28]PIX41658.1 MAG: protein translocase subunit SecD [Armatimonadetes bacterium CG_4_8_14_3_um_filter_58_9]PIY43768.1 MAG: protein translocase subunit SecD [Armatimonadetes bacterium CG_4_10_14_3_um_filter_59_10]PJB67963.1 MAG: protein translocase subunit SecD [Armatimonadetes bacterium CG_4_9_14_3_um_filter_58_7]
MAQLFFDTCSTEQGRAGPPTNGSDARRCRSGAMHHYRVLAVSQLYGGFSGMIRRRRAWLLVIVALVVACLEVVFQPIRRAPRLQEFEIHYRADRDINKLVKEGEDFDQVGGKAIDDVVTASGTDIVVTPEASTREGARKLEQDYTKKLRERFRNHITFVRSTGLDLPSSPRKIIGGLALYDPRPQLKLGLDLQGGSHLVLQVRRALFEYQFEKTTEQPSGPAGETQEERDAFLAKIGNLLEASGFEDVSVKVKEDSPDLIDVATQAMSKQQATNDRDKILNALKREFGSVTLVREETYFGEENILLRTVEIVRRRVDSLGVSEPLIQPQGDSQIIVELPGIDDPDKAIEMIGTTALLEFRHIPEKYEPEVERSAGGREIVHFVDKEGMKIPTSVVYNESKEIVSGRSLKPNSTVGMDPAEGSAVHFEFDSDGANKFGQFTRKNVGKYLAIFLDQQPISCPVIRQPITGGRGQISGGFDTIEEARDLMQLLNAGALPVPIDIVENRTVSATLGTDSIRRSLIAGLIGLTFVVIFMIAVYRLPGAIANLALAIYCLLVLATMIILNATLTLPGIAGFIMSIGMTVDTNILVFERMKEEFRTDKTFKSVIQAGFARAWTAILDSHVTTLIGAGVLFYYGTGPVKGFAVTLGLGVLTSLFTAFTISRVLVYTVAETGLKRSLPLWNAPRTRTT